MRLASLGYCAQRCPHIVYRPGYGIARSCHELEWARQMTDSDEALAVHADGLGDLGDGRG
jgi:hypothetical protein